jgi:hypothetical protein
VKKTTNLKMRGLVWLLPFAIPAFLFLALPVIFEAIEDFCYKMRKKTEPLAEKAGNFFKPPAWWPTHKLLEELNAERERIRQKHKEEREERLLSRVQKVAQ